MSWQRRVTGNEVAKFGTYFRDAGTGLDYADQRHYSATYGRFMSPDPYQASGGPGDPGSWNRYAYVGGDPVNFNDGSGLQREKVVELWNTIKRHVFGGVEGPPDESPEFTRPVERSPASLPSFRNRWEEHEFYGLPCEERAPHGPEGADIDANIAEAQAKVKELWELANTAEKAGVRTLTTGLDAMARPVSMSDNQNEVTVNSVGYNYRSQMTSMSGPAGTVGWGFNELGQLTSKYDAVNRLIQSTAQSWVETYSHDGFEDG